MDSLFGIGLPELILILILAGMVMGPQRIRQVARTLGRITGQLQSISREFARQLNAELDALDSGELKGTVNDLRSLQQEVEALRRELRQAPEALRRETQAAVEEGKAAVREGQAVLQDGRKAETVAGESPEAVDEPGEEQPALPNLVEIPDDPE